MSIYLRNKDDDAVPVDVVIFDHLGAKVPYENGVLSHARLSDTSLRSLISTMTVYEGEPAPNGSTLPTALPFALGS